MKLKLVFHDKRVHSTRGVINPLNAPKQSKKRESGITIYYKLL
jgi:hypothetical protein